MHQKDLGVLLLLMQPQLLDLISNRFSLLKHLIEPLSEREARPTLSLEEGKLEVHSVTHAHGRSLRLLARKGVSNLDVFQA